MEPVISMREISVDEYQSFVSRTKKIVVDGQEISLDPIRVHRFSPVPEELADVSTTVWSFPDRGSWATHRGDYRGNWAPQVARALILMYTEPGDLVVDPMSGSGTTCVEARLLGRNCIAVDISYGACMLTFHRLHWLEESAREFGGLERPPEVDNVLRTWSKVFHGDARRLDKVEDNSVDLIATHPPYWRIIGYGEGCVEGNLSCARTLEEYLNMIKQIAEEAFRVLKPGKYLGILVGDTRIRKHYVPITHHVLRTFLEAGFILREEIIKVQHRMKATREVWSRLRDRDFLLIHHEKLFVFRKPVEEGERVRYKYSSRL
ncbi:MAG: DNA methyltransferase [Desulfurococcaceae archaeon]